MVTFFYHFYHCVHRKCAVETCALEMSVIEMISVFVD